MKNSPGLPKYISISGEIITSIKNGTLEEGERIPSENEIIRKYGVSNTTARKVLQAVETSGWALRVKGKGTFVRKAKVIRAATKILSFTENMRQAGYTPSTRVLFQKITEGNHSQIINSRKFRLQGPLLQLRRLRLANGVPMMLEERFISLTLCPSIKDMALNGSLYEVYEQECGLHLTEVDQMLGAVIIKPDVSRHLELPENTPGMLVEGVTFCGRDTVLELERSVYRGDKYTFAVRAQGSRD